MSGEHPSVFETAAKSALGCAKAELNIISDTKKRMIVLNGSVL
jgi:hypothetical protein